MQITLIFREAGAMVVAALWPTFRRCRQFERSAKNRLFKLVISRLEEMQQK